VRSSKTLAVEAALLVAAQAVEPFRVETGQPTVDRVGVARPENAGASDGVGGGAVGDLEQGGGAFPDEGLGVVVAAVKQLPPLVVGKGKGTALTHGRFLHNMVAPVCYCSAGYRV